MKTVTVKRSDIPRGYFAESLVEWGHIVGNLSLSGMASEARKWSWYGDMRNRVTTAVWHAVGIDGDVVVYDREHRAPIRVWRDDQNRKVKLVIDYNS